MRVCWNRSTLPQVWGWYGRRGLGDHADARSLISKRTSKPRSLPGEVQAVVGELTERHAPEGGGLAERLPGGLGGRRRPAPDAQRDPGVVIEEADRISHHTGGDHPVDAVGLPQLVRAPASNRRHDDLGRFGLGDHEPAAHQDPPDRRLRRHLVLAVVAATEVALDRCRPVLGAELLELFAQRDDQVLHLDRDPARRRLRRPRTLLKPATPSA